MLPLGKNVPLQILLSISLYLDVFQAFHKMSRVVCLRARLVILLRLLLSGINSVDFDFRLLLLLYCSRVHSQEIIDALSAQSFWLIVLWDFFNILFKYQYCILSDVAHVYYLFVYHPLELFCDVDFDFGFLVSVYFVFFAFSSISCFVYFFSLSCVVGRMENLVVSASLF